MKFFSTLLAILIIGLVVPSTMIAQNTTPTPEPSQNQVPEDESELESIQKIKDIVASKVAELNLVEKRGIIGSVVSVNGTKVVVKDIKGNNRNIDVDELTKFEFSDDEDAGISDLAEGESYSFVGLYNKDTERLLTRTVDDVNTLPIYFEGAIKSIDDDEFQLTVVDGSGKEILVDIQNSTKTNLASEDGLIKSGFSKLEVNSRILAIGFWDKDEKDLLAASRVIHFEDIPPSKEMQAHVEIEEN